MASKNKLLMKNRIVIVGLDSFDLNLTLEWTKQGHLPFMTKLINSGVFIKLRSQSDLFLFSPWLRFSTGVSPAKDGIYFHHQLKRGTTKIVKTDIRDSNYLPFWSRFRNTEKKVAVFDVPKTYPIEGICGIQVCDWRSFYPLLDKSSMPTSLLLDLCKRFGKRPELKVLLRPRGASHELEIYKTMLSSIEDKLKATKFLLGKQDWDLFISVFAEPHFAAHQFYHHFYNGHWAYITTNGNELGDLLKKIYIELDSTLSELYRSFQNNATFFVVSVHGIKPNYSGNHLLPHVLELLNFQIPLVNRQTVGGIMNKMRSIIPESIKEILYSRILPQSITDKLITRMYMGNIDWKRTRAFCLPSGDFQGFISINLKGREPFGTVQPGTEYNKLCDQIRNELTMLINTSNGKLAVRDVLKISECYQGDNLLHMPDLIVEWADDEPINEVSHPDFGVISRGKSDLHKSQHTPQGFMIASGNKISKNTVLKEANILDLAPTFLYLMGEEVPNYMDGRVLQELFLLRI